MVTLEAAEAARREHEDLFAGLGAHAIEIHPRSDGSGYELIVHFAGEPPRELPRSVSVVASGVATAVRVTGRRSETA